MLEDTVSRLEARLYELEHPEETAPPVTLFDPYAPFQESYLRPPSLLAVSIPESSGLTPLSPLSATSESTFSSNLSSGSPPTSPRRSSFAFNEVCLFKFAVASEV